MWDLPNNNNNYSKSNMASMKKNTTQKTDETEPDVVFSCCGCGINIIRDSEAHDFCHACPDDEDKWYCVECKCDCSDCSPKPEPEPEPLPKCDECDCDLTEDDEKYWCNHRGEYICEECHSGAEKCDDEGCDCCAVEDDE